MLHSEAEADGMHFQVLSGLLLLSHQGALTHYKTERPLFSGEASLPEIQAEYGTYPTCYDLHVLRTEGQVDRQTYRDRLSSHQALLCMAPVCGTDIYA